MQFEGFAGNAALKTALSAAFSRRRLPHTLLLQGEAGLGKRTLAQILARAAVCTCEDRDLAPCGVCPACIRAKAGSHPGYPHRYGQRQIEHDFGRIRR